MHGLRAVWMLVASATIGSSILKPLPVVGDQLQAPRLVRVESGDLPVLITAPHGGFTPVPHVPRREERDGERVTLRRDELTQALAVQTARELERRLGKRPYLVVAEFSRESLDANRPEQTAYQDSAAATYYRDYHREIARFATEIRERFRQGLLLDVHAQWQRPTMLMRGTRDGQTIRGLLERHGWEGLLGPRGLLGALAADGVEVFPAPGEGEGRWTHEGSYTIATYAKDGIDGLQLEFGSELCDSENAVQQLAGRLAGAIETHLLAERQLSVSAEKPTSGLTALVDPEPKSDSTTPAEPKDSLSEAEQAFVDLLTNCVLVGRFTVDGAPDANPHTDRYAITKVSKTGGDAWIVEARITYGKVDIPLPVPVHVHWAGDTPVMSLTDLKLPGLGEGFTTRVLFYEDRYAGTWYHGKVGGHMWGKIEKKAVPAANDAKPAP